jgi:putative SOS response-associated peptidase YedK
MQADQAVLRSSKGPAQFDLGLISSPDIDLEDQAKDKRGLVVRWNPTTGERQLDELIWGLLPHGTKNPAAATRPINARAETVADHPMFAGAFRQCRAIVPATAYYQRRTTGGSGQSFAISRGDGRPMALAGLWESFKWPEGDITRSCCILTTEANSLVAPIHNRMPVVLEEKTGRCGLEKNQAISWRSSTRLPTTCCNVSPSRGKARTARDNRRDAGRCRSDLGLLNPPTDGVSSARPSVRSGQQPDFSDAG